MNEQRTGAATSPCAGGCACGERVARRDFLTRGVMGALGAIITTGCGDGDIGGTYPTNPFPAQPLTIRLADFPALANVGGMARVDGKTATPVAVVYTAPGVYTALSMVCPHQGATVDISGPATFRCPSHLAEFASSGLWTGGKQTGDLTVLGVTFNPAAGTLTINGPAAAAPPPALAVAPTSEVFAAVQGQASPVAQSVAITNSGGGSLTGLAAVVGYSTGQPTGWLTATLDVTSAPATLTLTPATTPLAAGAYSATVQVTSPTASNAPLSVSVSLLVSAVSAGVITLSASSLSFTGAKGGTAPPSQKVNITNSGGGSLTGLSIGTIAYGAGGSGWLSATLDTTSAPAVLTNAVTLGTLAAGTYTATVPLTATGASNSPQQVTVTLTVTSTTSPPTLALSPTVASFSASQGGAAPSSQTVAIQNAGGGSLGALSLGSIAYGGGASGWLSATIASSGGTGTVTLGATPGTLAAGTYTASVPVISAGVANSPQNIGVTLTIAAGPKLAVSPSSIAFAASLGANPGGQVVNITNSGGGTLSGLAFTVSYGAGATGWLSTSTLAPTTAPAALTLRAVTAAMPTGTFTATVQITAAGGLTLNVPVTVVIGPAGLAVVIANWPALAAVGGIAGSVGNVQGTPTAVVRTGANTYAAFSMRCPHQGTTIRIENWKNTGSAFHCPNHDALFDSTGKLLPSSPQNTSNLVARSVAYTSGDTTLYIS